MRTLKYAGENINRSFIQIFLNRFKSCLNRQDYLLHQCTPWWCIFCERCRASAYFNESLFCFQGASYSNNNFSIHPSPGSSSAFIALLECEIQKPRTSFAAATRTKRSSYCWLSSISWEGYLCYLQKALGHLRTHHKVRTNCVWCLLLLLLFEQTAIFEIINFFQHKS